MDFELSPLQRDTLVGRAKRHVFQRVLRGASRRTQRVRWKTARCRTQPGTHTALPVLLAIPPQAAVAALAEDVAMGGRRRRGGHAEPHKVRRARPSALGRGRCCTLGTVALALADSREPSCWLPTTSSAAGLPADLRDHSMRRSMQAMLHPPSNTHTHTHTHTPHTLGLSTGIPTHPRPPRHRAARAGPRF